MTTTTIKTLCSTKLTGSEAVQYTSPAGTTSVIKSAAIVNNTGAVVAVTVHKVPNGGSPDDTNILISSRNIADKESYLAYELLGKVLDPLETIQAVGLNVTFVLDGITVVQ